jgi:hypothetical protein
MSQVDATLEAVVIQVAFFALSILGAWIVLRILKGSASINNKGVQFGGAAAMFVAMFVLLNRYVPEMRDAIAKHANEARASQTMIASSRAGDGTPERVELSLSPTKQRVTSRDLKQLDRNKYFVDEKLGVALIQPPNDGWVVGTVDSVGTVSLVDIPMVGFGMGMFKTMLGEGLVAHPVVAFKERKDHTLKLNATSEVKGVRMNYNPFSDKPFVRKSIEANLSAMALMNEKIAAELKDRKEELLDEIEKAAGTQYIDGFEKYLQKSVPVEKHIQNGVYVTTFDLADSPGGAMNELNKSMSVLDRAIQSLALKGIQVGGGRNLKVDQELGVASYEGTLKLRRVTIDGDETDTIFNNLGFLVAVDNRIVFVQLIYLDLGEGMSTSRFLETVFKSLLFSP